MERNHPDIVALVSGALGENEAAQATEHLRGCQECAAAANRVREAVSVMERVATRFRAAHPDQERAAEVLNLLLGPAEGPDEISLPANELDELSDELAREVAKLRSGSLLSRVKKSIATFTDKTGQAADELAERLMAGGAAAAPATRNNATKVDGEEEPDETKK